MFWTWNTGYIFAKLQGISPNANAPGHRFSYHIGGYKKNEAADRLVQLNVSNTINININVNIDKWFKAAYDMPIVQHMFCHEPGKLAMQFADNYANMFTIVP
jgi:hypothetical protein